MSKYFIENNDVTRVSFPDGQWVDIKSEFTQEDNDYIMTAMMQARGFKTEKGEAKSEVEIKMGKQAALSRAIVAWSFADDNKPIPVTPENISRLRTKYRSPVLAEINRLNEAAKEFSKN